MHQGGGKEGLEREQRLQIRECYSHCSYRTRLLGRRALWKDADPDITILKEAKAEYAKRVLSSAVSRRVKVPLALK